MQPHTLQLTPPTNTLLNQPAQVVATADIPSDLVQGVIDRMLQLSAAAGTTEEDSRQMVGLAALQLGVPLRIISIDLAADGSLKPQQLQIVINPVITRRSTEVALGREGCWSCGNINGVVERATSLTLEGVDRLGVPLRLELTGFVARIAQHETDHLDGIRFPDRIPETMPERLHTVAAIDFQRYRTEWPTWTQLCPRSEWIAMKSGLESQR